MKIEAATAYPLSWPPGRPRTPDSKRSKSKFGKASQWQGGQWGGRQVSVAVGRDTLTSELKRLGARRVVISTNMELKNDGLPYSNRRPPDDPGAAVYFLYRDREMAFACDRWRSVGENLYAIAKTIEALRGIERWGTGEMVQAAFTGFAALPSTVAPDPPWRHTLGFSPDANPTLAQAEGAYLAKASKAHPDRGGSEEAMKRVNAAIEKARRELNDRKATKVLK